MFYWNLELVIDDFGVVCFLFLFVDLIMIWRMSLSVIDICGRFGVSEELFVVF